MARILVVDDEPSILKIVKMNLEMEGHEAILAGDGETALKRIESEAPDLILLDIMMPAVDGWEVLRRLNTMKLSKPPRVVMITAKAGLHNLARGLGLGADEYMTKPFEIEDLVRMVSNVLARTKEQAEERRRELLEEWS